MSTLILDIEVENHAYFGAVASPRHPQNYVVATGFARDNAPVQGVYYPEFHRGSWLPLLDGVTLIVAHNAAFELDWMLRTEREATLAFIKRGGQFFCTAYAEYLLTNQQSTYPSLNETAPKYGGAHKVDGVKALWDAGKLTSEIDKALLFDEYLVGPGGDIENTRKCYIGQMHELQRRGMLGMFMLRMQGLVFNAFAMDAGLHVHRDIASSLQAEQEKRLLELQEGFKSFRTAVPDYVEFKESSDFHMSAWLFGGPIKYKIRDTWYEEDGVSPKYEKAEAYVSENNGQVSYLFVSDAENMTDEEKFAYVTSNGPLARYKAGKNKGQLKTEKVPTSVVKQKWYERVLHLHGAVPMGLLPKDFLDEWAKENKQSRTLCDGSPVYSTGGDALKALSLRQEFPEHIRQFLTELCEYAKVDKDLGTYYLREKCDEEGNVVKRAGMLQYLTDQNIVYHVLNTTSTATTRLSSNRPNMQNTPRGDTSDVKKMFTSRYDDPKWLAFALTCGVITQGVHDWCLQKIQAGERAGAVIEADYSALEVVTLAAFSKDANLIKALIEGIDMHCMRLSQQLGESYESVLEKCKNEEHPEHKKYKTLRTNIKPKAFAYQYGATAMGIAFNTGCTVEEAQAFIDAEKKLFPGVEAWYENQVFPQVYASKSIHREMGEDGSFRVYGRGVWVAPGGTTYEFREFPKSKWVNGQRVSYMEFKPTQMRNYPIQGESGFFVQGIAGQVMQWLVQNDMFQGRVQIINQVHDAIYLDCTLDVLQHVALCVKFIMESLPKLMQPYGYDLGVPFPAEVEAGPSMFEKSKVQLPIIKETA